MPTFYCNYYFLTGTRGPLHSGAPWTLPTLPTPLLRHCPQYTYLFNKHLLQRERRFSKGLLKQTLNTHATSV